MAKLDPPVTLKDERNELRLSYIQNVITPLPEYETNFSPVSRKILRLHDTRMLIMIIRSFMNMLKLCGMMKVFRKLFEDQMNIN